MTLPRSEQAKRDFFRGSVDTDRKFAHRTEQPSVVVEDDRTGMSVATLKRAIADNLYYLQGKNEEYATPHDWYMALSYTVRDRLMQRWLKTMETFFLENDAKAVFYLSAEFLMGRQLGKNLLNIGCFRNALRALKDSGLNLYDLMEQEPDPGLGNGGLGRLAACFLDSLATLSIPAVGYGIRYEYGIFKQGIEGGWQIERPDQWLKWGNPWEIARPELLFDVKFGGHVEHQQREDGSYSPRWVPARVVSGIPYDTLVPGYDTNTVNTLRLWAARSTNDFDFAIFDAGDYTRAVAEKTFSENISKVLYPNDNTPQGKELRLRQQYFFVSCSLQDIVRTFLLRNKDLRRLPRRAAVQLNDTHPAVGVAELMRILMDDHGLSWEDAWDVTVKCFGYTNHTLLPEALERWPVGLFGRLLPRHLEIIYGINQRFLDEVQVRFPNDDQRLGRMSIVEEGEEKQIRMAHLATVGSHAVNGVAAMHSELVKHELLRDFHEMYPERFSNKTNGVTPRRFVMLSNMKLAYLITERIGRGWITDLNQLRQLEDHLDDPGFQEVWRIFKDDNKQDLAQYILEELDVKVDPDSLFDVQVKRIHEYKRQHLFLLFIITEYLRIKDDPNRETTPRTCVFGGKAAPGYHMAKLIIKLINSVANVVNNDPQVGDRLKVVFLPNFSVSVGERVYPAADLSEQISTAGKEASGTGNMKFALNGSLTIGTLDGANVEIRDAVGEENFFLFGLNVDEVRALKNSNYQPWDYYHRCPELKRALDCIGGGMFSGGDTEMFRPLVDSLLGVDEYLVCADFEAYLRTQDSVSSEFENSDQWIRKSILNVARMGYFSSDRTINEYCRDIWKAKPLHVELESYTQERAGIQVEPLRDNGSDSVPRKSTTRRTSNGSTGKRTEKSTAKAKSAAKRKSATRSSTTRASSKLTKAKSRATSTSKTRAKRK